MVAAANRLHRGVRQCAAASRVSNPTVCTARLGSNTRAWPSRSIQRPTSGAADELAIARQAATAPATPYEPVLDWTSSTVPSPIMDIGNRPTKPAETKPRVPLIASSCE